MNVNDYNTIQITAEMIHNTGMIINQPGSYAIVDDIVFRPFSTINNTSVSFLVGTTGNGAAGFAVVSGGSVRGVFITNGGSGYLTPPTILFNGTGENAQASVQINNGSVIGVTMINNGTGYENTVQCAITIQSSNVRLSLGNHRILLDGYDQYNNVISSQVPFVCGILIDNIIPDNTDIDAVGIESVYIDGNNAVIDGFSMWGILVRGNTSDIRCSNISIINCGKLAGTNIRPFENYFPNGNPNNLSQYPGTVPFGVGGINIGETDMLGLGTDFFYQNEGPGNSSIPQNRIDTVFLTNVSCINNYSFGLNMSNTSNIFIKDCHFDDNFCDDSRLWSVGAAFGWIDLSAESLSITDLYIENSTFNGIMMNGNNSTQIQNTTIGSFGAIGCSVSQGNNIQFKNCQFSNIATSFPGDEINAPTCGFLINHVINCKFINCYVDNISSLNSTIGFYFNNVDTEDAPGTISRNITLINCTTNNIQQNGIVSLIQQNSLSCGFKFDYVKNIYLEKCSASNIILNGPCDITGEASGFHLSDGYNVFTEDQSDNSVLRNCSTQKIYTEQGGNSYGFKFLNYHGAGYVLRALSLNNCVVESCCANIPTISQTIQGVAIGFMFQRTNFTDDGYPVQYYDCKVLHCKGANNIFDNIYGTLYSAAYFANSSSVYYTVDNHVYLNCSAVDNVYGFLLSNANNCIIRNCKAELNVNNSGDTGEGFTDLGIPGTIFSGNVDSSIYTPTLSTFALNNSASLINNFYVGNLLVFNSGVNDTIMSFITAYNGTTQIITLGYELPNLPNNGDLFSIYQYGTPAQPFPSISLFASNRAFCNGPINNNSHFGQNQNYNVIYGTDDQVPLIKGSITNSTGGSGSNNYYPELSSYSPMHNVSMVKF